MWASSIARIRATGPNRGKGLRKGIEAALWHGWPQLFVYGMGIVVEGAFPATSGWNLVGTAPNRWLEMSFSKKIVSTSATVPVGAAARKP